MTKKAEKLEIIDGILHVNYSRLVGLAKILGFSEIADRKKLEQSCREGMPYLIQKTKEKLYPLEDVIAWYMKNKLSIDDMKAIHLQAQIDEKQAKVAKLNLEYAITKRKYVSVDEIGEHSALLIAKLKQHDRQMIERISDINDRKRMEAHVKQKWDSIQADLTKIYEMGVTDDE